MKKTHSLGAHLLAIILGTVLFGMSVYAVQIPTSLNNAIQYIMQTVWTSDGTSSGTVNVRIGTGGIYIATGLLSNGNAWNNQGLAIDQSGNVVYSSFSSSNPYFSLQGDFIPKLNTGGTGLEASTMYQSNGLIGVNMGATQADYTMQIHGNFKVQTPSSNTILQYTNIGSNTGFTNGPFSFPLPSNIFSCSCDLTNTGAECVNSFTSNTLEGPGNNAFDYCFDYIGINTGSLYNYNVYIMSIVSSSADTVLSTTGTRVGINTDTPQAALDVSGNVMIRTTPAGLNTWDILTINPMTKEISTRTAGSFAGTPGWALVGNGGTNPITNFIGTTDNQSFTVKVNNIQIQRYYPNGTIVGGFAHTYTNGLYSLMAGGSGNTLSGDYVTIGGGGMNYALGYGSTIVGGRSNTISSLYGFIGGGFTNNIVNSTQSVIGGGSNNRILANSDSSVIVGGSGNTVDGQFGTNIFIGGGISNTGSQANSVVVGGSNNQATQNGFVGGGIGNRAIGSPIVFGPSNVVVGGNFNTAQGLAGFIGGGVGNAVLGDWATVPGGYQNTGFGDYSFAAGKNAIASGDNSFVWSDGYTTFNSNSNIRLNEFRVNSYLTALGRASNTSWAYNFYIGSTPILSATVVFGALVTDNVWSENAIFANAPIISDQSLKDTVTNANGWGVSGLSLVEQLNPVTFHWKDSGTASEMGLDPSQLHYGFIAQQVENVIPNIIRNLDVIDQLGLPSRQTAVSPLKSIETIEMVPILVQAIKEQQALIVDLQTRVTALEQNP